MDVQAPRERLQASSALILISSSGSLNTQTLSSLHIWSSLAMTPTLLCAALLDPLLANCSALLSRPGPYSATWDATAGRYAGYPLTTRGPQGRRVPQADHMGHRLRAFFQEYLVRLGAWLSADAELADQVAKLVRYVPWRQRRGPPTGSTHSFFQSLLG